LKNDYYSFLFGSPQLKIFIVFLSFVSLYIFTPVPRTAFSDGLFEEKLPPASLGNRQLSLFTKINPPLLTPETENQTKYLQLELSDADSNKTIPHVYYYVSISKDGDLLMRELFHSHQGSLIININPLNEQNVKVFGDREPFMGAWTAYNLNNSFHADNITIQAPILNEGGLYDLQADIFGIDNDTNRFKAINSLAFDSGLSVGEINVYDINHLGRRSNVTVITYYDSIKNFSFSSQNGSISWDMPFDWDTERFKRDQSILVHQEIKIPKRLAANSTDAFVGKVNGEVQTGRSFVVDPFSSQDVFTIHYIIGNNDLLKMANSSDIVRPMGDSDRQLMRFELGGFKR
jgi:hypothetical protein